MAIGYPRRLKQISQRVVIKTLCSCGCEFIRYICYNCGNVDESISTVNLIPVIQPRTGLIITQKLHTTYKYKKRRSKIPESKRQRIFRRDGHLCLKCWTGGSKDNPLTIDHIIPRVKGGTNDDDNLQTLCLDCNQSKQTQIKDYRKISFSYLN